MSKDQMQDVFPIAFDFAKGEQPTAQKFTGLVKHTDTAFSRITQGIGDPWDYASHTDSLSLSLEKLGQSSLARILGSSDWLSPTGGCWNQGITVSSTVVLESGRNSWTLGFPLVKLSGTTIEDDSTTSVVTELIWGIGIGSDIGVVPSTDTGGVLDTEVGTPELVVAHGDFYVDYYKGTITSYTVPSSDITLLFTAMNMFGPGVPWGTHNVIPHWDQSTLCNVALDSSTATTSTYILTFPTVSGSSRLNSISEFGRNSNSSTDASDVTWAANNAGQTSLYRLPSSLTASGIPVDYELPEGYCLLWSGTDGRVIPQVTFKYLTANTMTLVTPYLWLDQGDNYRLIISGTSAAENINYLMQTVRNNEHVGLTNNPSLSYTIPLSHENLQDRFTSNDTSTSAIRWKFRESSYSTNPHPQYLHRGGYMDNDDDGNSANAMRGDLVMAGDILTGFELGEGTTPEGIYKTAALAFGGGNTSTLSSYSNAFIRLEGVEDSNTYDPWVSGRAKRIPFGLDATGTTMYGTSDLEYLGALSVYPWKTTPLYLRGAYTGNTNDDLNNGAILGFDMGQRTEANYIRLMKSIRSSNEDRANLPINIGQTASAILPITPSLTGRLSSTQIREFRFRAVPYVGTATNTSDSIGGSNVRSVAIPEFQNHFTSPAIVGADFFNVYSNAIFFSDTGDGKATSFTTNGSNWLNSGTSTSTPTGLYYTPTIGVAGPHLSLYCYDGVSTTPSFSVGRSHGLHFDDNYGPVVLQSGDPTVFAQTSSVLNRAAAYAVNLATGMRNVVACHDTSLTGTSIYSAVNDIRIASGNGGFGVNGTLFANAQQCHTTVNITGNGLISALTTPLTRITDSVNIAAAGGFQYGQGSAYNYDNNVMISAGKDVVFGDSPTDSDVTGSFSGHLRMYADTRIYMKSDSAIYSFAAGLNSMNAVGNAFVNSTAGNITLSALSSATSVGNITLQANKAITITGNSITVTGSMTIDDLISLDVSNLPTGSTQPAGVAIGEVWVNTVTPAYPVLTVAVVAT